MKVLVTGAAGLLGTDIVSAARGRGHEVVGLARADLDVTDEAGVRDAFETHRPHAVVHCAAYTAVDRAESEADLAMRVNRGGSANVATAAAATGAEVVYVSTDFVFDGTASTPYRPYHVPGPLGAYARSKVEGEMAQTESVSLPLIVRTSWLYGAVGKTFVRSILEQAAKGEALRVVGDQRGCPTWSANAAGVLLELLERGARGIWHVTDGGEATWHDVAREALRLRGIEADVLPVTTESWGAPAPRPRYSVLDVSATEALLARRMMPWREALRAFLATQRIGDAERAR
jgi:dTDP-4-dehydrorhamnose reductase